MEPQPRSETPLAAENPTFEALAPTPAERLRELGRMLRRRWPLILLIVVLVTGGAVANSLRSPNEYDATAKLLLRENEPIEALLGRGVGGASTDPERETNTKVALIKLETVADRVARKVGLRIPASQLLGQVSAQVEGNSDIVAITVRDRVAARAARLANAFAREYVAYRRQSARSSIDEAAGLARTRLESLSPADQASQEGRQLEARLRELEIASSLQTGGAEVVRRADTPSAPATPRPVRTGLLGLFLGLVLALIVAVLREFVDRRLKDEDQAQSVFEMPILATIPRPTRGSEEVLLNGDRDVEEGYGTVAANVVLSRQSRGVKTLMVTSPRSRDGKTSVTLGLARALRLLGQSVIVIEADLHHPRFVQVLEIEQRRGLSSLLARVGDLEDELVTLNAYSRTVKDGNSRAASFSVLPAGPVPPNPAAMLSRPAMGAILEECRELADIVLIDTAPVGLVHDPLTLVNHVDGVIVVSRLQWTTKDAARRALRLLRQVRAPMLGVVLTGGERVAGYYGDSDSRHYGRPQPKSKLKKVKHKVAAPS